MFGVTQAPCAPSDQGDAQSASAITDAHRGARGARPKRSLLIAYATFRFSNG